MNAIDEFIVLIDGTVEEAQDVRTMSFPAPVNLRSKINALADVTDKSKSFIIRGLMEAAISEAIPKLDPDLKQRYADRYQEILISEGFVFSDNKKGKK